jgi:hypothetical protein
MKTERAVLFVGATVVLLMAVVFQVLASPGIQAGFEIDGNTAVDQEPPGEDWESVILDGGSGWTEGPGLLIRDGSSGPKAVTPEENIFAKGGKFGVPEEWIIEPGNTPAQNDLTNVYVYPVFPEDPDSGGNTWMVMGMERIKKQGTFDLDFEYNQVPWDGTSGTLVRTPGDISVGFELSGNPEDPQADLEVLVVVYDPDDVTCADWAGVYGEGWCVAFSGAGGALGAFGEATMNAVAFDQPPWGSFQSSGAPLPEGEQVQPFFFAEAALNLTALGLEPGCPGFGSVHAKSRSSLEITADMKDLAGPRTLPIQCGLFGYKYKDVNGDGTVPNDDDTPLQDWTIELQDGSCTPGGDCITATTNISGFYEFGGLSDGTYTVAEICPEGWAQTYPTPTDGCGSGVHSGIEISISNKYAGPYNFGNAQGSIILRKVVEYADSSTDLLGGAGFTFDVNPFDGGAPIEIDDWGMYDQADNDDGILCIDDVILGSYVITETQVPAGYAGDPSSQTVTVDSSGTCSDRLGAEYDPATVSADATFTNTLGSIIIRKEAKDKSAEGGTALLGGAGFTFDPSPFVDGTGTPEIFDGGAEDQADGEDGILCIDDVLLYDSYVITETAAPTTTYAADPEAQLVEVSSGGTCAERLGTEYDPETVSADATFVNVPLSEIEVIFRSLAGYGVTEAVITCVDKDGAMAFDSGTDDEDEVYTLLPPETYTCTIVIDP